MSIILDIPKINLKIPGKISFKHSLPLTSEEIIFLIKWLDFLKIAKISSKIKEQKNNSLSILGRTYRENIGFFGEEVQKIFSPTPTEDLEYWISEGKIYWLKIIFYSRSDPKQPAICFFFNFFDKNIAEIGFSIDAEKRENISIGTKISEFIKSQTSDLPSDDSCKKVTWIKAGNTFYNIIDSIGKLK